MSPTTPIRPSAFIDSHLRCPYDGKRLVVDMGPDDYNVIEIRHHCLECRYVEFGPRTVAEVHSRSDVPQVRAVHESLREQLARLRLGGEEVPLVYDDEPVEVEW